MWNSHKKREQCKKRNHRSNLFRTFNKYIIRQLFLETLVLVLHCGCGDNVKYGLLSERLFQRKQEHGY